MKSGHILPRYSREDSGNDDRFAVLNGDIRVDGAVNWQGGQARSFDFVDCRLQRGLDDDPALIVVDRLGREHDGIGEGSGANEDKRHRHDDLDKGDSSFAVAQPHILGIGWIGKTQ